MIERIVGEIMKILSVKYNDERLQFEVECILPGQKVAGVYSFDRKNFPKHTPFQILDEKVQVGEILHVWIKNEKELMELGWKNNTKHTLSSSDSPFKIGKNKKPYLGGSHKGIVCIDSKFRPFVRIKDFRFSPKELNCVLRSDLIFQGKSCSLTTPNGDYRYNADNGVITTPEGYNFDKEGVNNLIDVMRRAKLI